MKTCVYLLLKADGMRRVARGSRFKENTVRAKTCGRFVDPNSFYLQRDNKHAEEYSGSCSGFDHSDGGGNTAVAGTPKYLNDQVDKVGHGIDWTETVSDTNERVALVNDGKAHSITGFNVINILHNAPGNNGSWKAENGSTLNISANEIRLSQKAVDAGRPNLIHAIGGTINIQAVNDVVLAGEGESGAVVMTQAYSNNSALANITSTEGSVTIKSNDRGAINAGLLNKDLKGLTTTVIINAAKNVTLATGAPDRAAVQLFNQNMKPNDEWKGDAGNASMTVTAGEELNISGGLGVQSKVTLGEPSLKSSFSAGKSINITTAGSSLIMDGDATEGSNSVAFDAPEVNLASTNAGVSTINVSEQNTSIAFGNGKTSSVVNITSNQGNAVSVTAETSALAFTNSTVNADGDVSSTGVMNLTDTTFNLLNDSTFTNAVLKGSNSAIVVDEIAEGSTAVKIDENNVKDLQVVASSGLNDQYVTAAAAAAALADATAVTDGTNGSHTLKGQSGALSDTWVADADGTITTISTNQSLDAFGNYNAMTLVQWRNEVNHISQRLGDVRDSSTTIGAWARVYGYDSSYDDNVSIDFKANSIQAGGDYRINNTWLVGGAFSYTDGEGKFSNGSADSDGYSLAAYLSGFFDCGGYVDFVGRIGRLSTDITAYSDASEFKGAYNNTTFGLSAEVGYHWKLNDTFYVEPQAELAYGFVKGDDFTGANDVRVEQDDFQTLVGRIGARIGASFADGAGTVYAHASVNHDFLGDADYTASLGSASRDLSVDIGGTWVSYGIGAQFNTSKNLNFYGTLERANGSEYQEDYRYSVGMSYRF